MGHRPLARLDQLARRHDELIDAVNHVQWRHERYNQKPCRMIVVDPFTNRTPESRTANVLVLMAVIGAIVVLWRLLVASRIGVELVIATVAAAVTFAVWRFARQRG